MKLIVNHSYLVNKGAEWLNKKAPNINYKCQFVCVELVCQGINEIPDIIGLSPYRNILIEVKVSKSDFLRDKNKKCRKKGIPHLGNRRFYLTPKNLISEKDLPEKWGLLEFDGNNIEIKKDSEWFEDVDDKASNFIYYSIIRRLNKPQVFDFRKK